MSESAPENANIINLPKILAVGIASPAATLLTSHFGVAGTLLGLVVSAMFVTAAADFLKVYLARVPGAVTTIPGGLKEKSLFRRVFERIKVPFSKFGSLPRPQRRSILLRSVVAAGASILVGLIIITGLEFGVGKSLSCWVWDECPTQSAAAEGASSTLPSILGGGQSTGASITQEEESPSEESPSEESPSEAGPSEESPSNLQQQPDNAPGTPKAPSQAPADHSAQPGQRQGPAGVPEQEVQQQALPGAAEDQQQPPPGDAPEEFGE
jgi:hypothetical protein